MADNDDAWFAKSATGLSYRPVRWPGWLVLGIYIAALIGLTVLLPRHMLLFHALVAILTVALLVITVRTSRPE